MDNENEALFDDAAQERNDHERYYIASYEGHRDAAPLRSFANSMASMSRDCELMAGLRGVSEEARQAWRDLSIALHGAKWRAENAAEDLA